TIRLCDHDGELHYNEDVRVFHQISGSLFKQSVTMSPYHRQPFNGSSAWDSVRPLFDIPNASQTDITAFFAQRR
ncbi:MAG TPA: hypothetical protein VJ124_11440, partial [Pyrinomonadaceae bacterium]|nr:hypothetical protein [Pyrinomonadaceae bacterium]